MTLLARSLITRRLFQATVLAATALCLTPSCIARAGEPDDALTTPFNIAHGEPDDTLSARFNIAHGDDAAAVLGPRTKELDYGKPLPLNLRARRLLSEVYTTPGEVPQLTVSVDGKTLELPLKHTHVRAELTGSVARVQVTQSYYNAFSYPIEAVYIFPLPENSAVDDMNMRIGDRLIKAEIQKRADARATYEAAKQRGNTAALLEQERPNIFTQSVANIEPGATIDVMVRYAQTLTYDSGEYEFVFPMVVGPRFVPGQANGGLSGTGYARDTHSVPDGSRITPSIIGGGLRSGHDISLELVANAGFPIRVWDVPTHDVVETRTDRGLKLRLSKEDKIPNRDFVLKYRVDAKQAQAALISHRKNGEGFFQLILQPPQIDVDRLVGQREIVFVVDTSGSMSGVPLSMVKDAMRQAMSNLRPVDTFNVITFAGSTGMLFNTPRPANDTNRQAATAFVDGLRGGGGTMMGAGVSAALTPPVEAGRHRYVFFMTDGYIGNEKGIARGARQLVKELARKGQKAKVFSFGPGSSVNRHLLQGLADAGNGLAVYSSTREDPTLAVNKFFSIIDHTVLEDVSISWGGLEVSDTFPAKLPSLFASRPLIVHGKLGAPSSGEIVIHAKTGGRAIEIPVHVDIPNESESNAVLAPLWARAKIGELERDAIYQGSSQQITDAVTQLGLNYRLVTQYTSFVAVDRSKTVSGRLHTIAQPVEAPEGVNPHAAGARVISRASAKSVKRAKPKKRAKHKPYSTALRAPQPSRSAPAPRPSYDYGSGRARTESRRSVLMDAPSMGSASGMDHDDYGDASPAVSAPAKMPAPPPAPEPPRKIDGLQVSGAISSAAVRRILLRHHSAARTCVAKSAGSRSVRVTVKFFISATGRVLQARYQVSGGGGYDKAVEACLSAPLKNQRFPVPSNGAPVSVRYIFRF